jgi:hypothetical protein
MAARDGYGAQVELLLRCLPAVASVPDFALKGGTAINLFLRDMPRLSVDIDLTYLPVSERGAALTDIRSQLATIAEAIQRYVPGANVQLVESDAPKLLVDKSGARIKVEPSIVIRGSLVPPVLSELCSAAQEPGHSCSGGPRAPSTTTSAGFCCPSSKANRIGRCCRSKDWTGGLHSMEVAQHPADGHSQPPEGTRSIEGSVGL